MPESFNRVRSSSFYGGTYNNARKIITNHTVNHYGTPATTPQNSVQEQFATPYPSNPIQPAHVIPPPPSHLLEREDQREALVSLLTRSSNARVAVLGPMGIGKTTLVAAVLNDSRVVETYTRRHFLSFEGLSTMELVFAAFANALGFVLGTNPHPYIQIGQHLEGATSLLCLDNFETFWEPTDTRPRAEELLRHLSHIPNLAIIVTLRGTQRPNALRWTRPHLPPLRPLSLTASKRLLGDIVQDQSNGSYDIQDTEYTQSLLTSVEGIPLAVTLISYQLRDGNETPASLWKRWNREHTSMIRTSSGDNDRHSALDPSIALSIECPRMQQLPEAREVLEAIAVLPDGFPASIWHEEPTAEMLEPLPRRASSVKSNREIFRAIQNLLPCCLLRAMSSSSALEFIAMSENNSTTPAASWLDRLQELLPPSIRLRECIQTLKNVGLISLDTATLPHRLRLLSPIRQFCLHRLRAENPVLMAISQLYHRLLDQYDAQTQSTTHHIHIMPEIKNIAAVLRRVNSISPFLDDNQAKMAISFAKWAMTLRTPNTDVLEPLMHRQGSRTDPRIKGKGLQILGCSHLQMAEREAGPNNLEVTGQQPRSPNVPASNHLRSAEGCLKEAVEVHRRTREAKELALDLKVLAGVHVRQGLFAQAEQELRRSLKIHKQENNILEVAEDLRLLANVHKEQNRPGTAERELKEALELDQTANFPLGVASDFTALATLYMDQGHLREAEQALQHARRHTDPRSHDFLEGWNSLQLGRISVQHGKLAKSIRHFERAVHSFAKSEHPRYQGWAQEELEAAHRSLSLSTSADSSSH